MAEIQYEVRERDLMAFNEFQLQYSKEMQQSIRRNQSRVPGLIVFIALFYWFYYQDVFTSFYIALIGVMWGLVVPVYIRWSVLNTIRKKYTDKEKEKILGDYTLRLEPKVLIEISPHGENSVEWTEVLRMAATKKHAFIYVGVNEALIIPKKTVKKGNFREFVNRANELVEAAVG